MNLEGWPHGQREGLVCQKMGGKAIWGLWGGLWQLLRGHQIPHLGLGMGRPSSEEWTGDMAE